METINKLLKKQAPKRRGKDPTFAPSLASGPSTIVVGGGGAENNTNATPRSLLLLEAEAAAAVEKPNPVYVRWVSNRGGCKVGVPGEWIGGAGGLGGVLRVEGEEEVEEEGEEGL